MRSQDFDANDLGGNGSLDGHGKSGFPRGRFWVGMGLWIGMGSQDFHGNDLGGNGKSIFLLDIAIEAVSLKSLKLIFEILPL